MEAGADDYMTKPFDLDVLLAKVQAQMRRNYGELGVSAHGLASVKRDGITFYPRLQRVEWDGRVVELSAVESSLFACLMKAYPETASRSDLYMAAWDDESYVEANTLNVNIRRLRDCFARAGIPVEIKVVRTVGYRLSIDGDGS